MPSARGLNNHYNNDVGSFAANGYEMVFDHLNEDSIHDHTSNDMDEQPTVMLVEDTL